MRKLWERIDADISKHGGWVTSVAYMFPVRFECAPDLALPKYLRGQGYLVSSAGTAERFLPQTELVKINAMTSVKRQHLAPGTVEIWELQPGISVGST
jgi:hypothetical protein